MGYWDICNLREIPGYGVYCEGQLAETVIRHGVDLAYRGPNVRLGDYYVRELERIGTEHRQVVRFLVVGTGRMEQLPRSRFDKMVRPA